jgi:hypothetical protein
MGRAGDDFSARFREPGCVKAYTSSALVRAWSCR